MATQAAYNIINHQSNVASGPKYEKALIKNLRHQSPFTEGNRNRDYVSPTLTSNVVLYNHANDPVNQPHSKFQRHEWRPSGYDLNNYVGQGVHREPDIPVKPAAEQKYQEVRRKVESRQANEETRSNVPERHNERSARAHSANSRQAAAAQTDVAAYESGPGNVVAAPHGRAQNQPAPLSARNSLPERSARAARNKTAEPAPEPVAEQPRESDSVPSGAGQAVYDLRHNKIGVIAKDKNPYVVIDKDGISRCGTIYEKVSGSQISHPEDLICDNCANQNIAADKHREREEQRERDADFARKVNDNLRNQLEEERKRQLDKLKTYQDAIDTQRKDHLNRKEAEKAAQEAENERLKKVLENRDDEVARLEKERLKKQNFIGDLKDQMDQKKDLDKLKREQEDFEDKRNPNLLIDDAWRAPHREAMKDYYKNYLIDQLNDTDKQKNLAKEKAKKDDDDYKKKLAQMNAEELARVRDIEDEKRKIFMDEIQKQLGDKDRQKQFENDIKNAEDDLYKKKLQHDHQVYLDNLFKKKQQVDDYLNTLGKQIVDKDMEKRIHELEAKKRYNTTLCLGKKPVKCYNCAVCRSIYPLKMLNKKHRLA